MENKINEIEVNGVKYVPKDSIAVNEIAVDTDGLEYSIIRGKSSGVFAGYVEEEDGQEVVLINCRRLWYWDGAASISQIAVDGVSKPSNCKFPAVVPKIKIKDVLEIILATEKARKSIEAVKVWVG